MISITNIIHPTGSPLISPCHAISDITVPTETGDKLMPTQGRGFPGFLPVCMQGIWGWLSSQVCPLPTAWKSTTCTHAYDHITWNNKSFEMRWCYKCINDHTKIIMPGFRMLAFNVWKGKVLSKLLKVFFSFPKILFEKYIWINTYFKNRTKKLFENFSNKS